MIVVHVAFTCAEDYVARRQPHRRTHIERLAGLRHIGALIGGGPAVDGRTADIVYRLQQPGQLEPAIKEDPYWIAGAWTGYTPRSFSHFVEPWQAADIVLDGSRPATIVEGRVADRDMGEFSLIELRGAGRLAFGGFFEGGDTFALCRSGDAEEALGWFRDTGFWNADTLRSRPLLWVL